MAMQKHKKHFVPFTIKLNIVLKVASRPAAFVKLYDFIDQSILVPQQNKYKNRIFFRFELKGATNGVAEMMIIYIVVNTIENLVQMQRTMTVYVISIFWFSINQLAAGHDLCISCES